MRRNLFSSALSRSISSAQRSEWQRF
jgi:hypothetical protein